MQAVCFLQCLNHENLNAAPRAIIILRINDTYHCVALSKVHWKRSNSRCWLILVDTSEVLAKIGIKHASVLYTIFIAWRELGSRILALIGNPPIRKEQDELINLTGLIPGKVACVSVI
ncbi:hypothetical protein GGP41_006985 [Bipolaris sorokiniana]|uniref:Uncharacterized protein n=1 Tax=Cochliobolus sativus TaxID=45130 RepID=A0A8H6DZW8_COCSA|nr:hypothetical protein GGP41_006985 [Bipolaris sorokiniana]